MTTMLTSGSSAVPPCDPRHAAADTAEIGRQSLGPSLLLAAAARLPGI